MGDGNGAVAGVDPVGALVAGFVCACVAGAVGHGVLRPLLEARGVTPWRLRDSLGSLPLVIGGTALIGTGAAVVVGWLFGACGGIMSAAAGKAHGPATVATAVGGTAALLVGALMLRLGLLALRKLT